MDDIGLFAGRNQDTAFEILNTNVQRDYRFYFLTIKCKADVKEYGIRQSFARILSHLCVFPSDPLVHLFDGLPAKLPIAIFFRQDLPYRQFRAEGDIGFLSVGHSDPVVFIFEYKGAGFLIDDHHRIDREGIRGEGNALHLSVVIMDVNIQDFHFYIFIVLFEVDSVDFAGAA